MAMRPLTLKSPTRQCAEARNASAQGNLDKYPDDSDAPAP